MEITYSLSLGVIKKSYFTGLIVELIQELKDINSSFVNDINTKLSNLEKKFNDY